MLANWHIFDMRGSQVDVRVSADRTAPICAPSSFRVRRMIRLGAKGISSR
jgi:hypothetical protein